MLSKASATAFDSEQSWWTRFNVPETLLEQSFLNAVLVSKEHRANQQTHDPTGKGGGRSPPPSPICLYEGRGRFDPVIDDFRTRILNIRSKGPLSF